MKISASIILAALLTLAFTLATILPPQVAQWSSHAKSDNFLSLMFGDSRKIFANQFYTMADVYFHSGYYPSVFDRAKKESEVAEASHGHTDTPDEEAKEDFFGKPKDWIDRFGRNFRIMHHTHLENGNEREILPWLKLAAELDPQKIETYTVSAYYLSAHLHQPREAELFLREGLRNNPDNCEILFELGRVYYENDHDVTRARNLWELGVRKSAALPEPKSIADKAILDRLLDHLAKLEDENGNFAQAIHWLQTAKSVSPDPAALQERIAEIQKKITAQNSAANSGATNSIP
jgi:tetratricopeptide (TPR) repeat protein